MMLSDKSVFIAMKQDGPFAVKDGLSFSSG